MPPALQIIIFDFIGDILTIIGCVLLSGALAALIQLVKKEIRSAFRSVILTGLFLISGAACVWGGFQLASDAFLIVIVYIVMYAAAFYIFKRSEETSAITEDGSEGDQREEVPPPPKKGEGTPNPNNKEEKSV